MKHDCSASAGRPSIGALHHQRSTRMENRCLIETSTRTASPPFGAEVGGDGAHHGSTQGGHQRDGQPVPTRQQATEDGDARSVRQAARLHPPPRRVAGAHVGQTVFERRDGELVKIVLGQRRQRRQSRRIYNGQVFAALRKIWYLFGCLCGKRLVAVLRTQLPVLEQFGELAVDPRHAPEAHPHQRRHHRPAAAHRASQTADSAMLKGEVVFLLMRWTHRYVVH